MSLKLELIERVFGRLIASYGSDFMDKYKGQDPATVKAAWAHELRGYATTLQSIAWALENLPVKPPNVFEFRAVCRMAPSKNAGLLPAPKSDPETIAREVLQLGELKIKAEKQNVDRLDWARALKAKDEANKNSVTFTQRRMYRAALRRELPEGVK